MLEMLAPCGWDLTVYFCRGTPIWIHDRVDLGRDSRDAGPHFTVATHPSIRQHLE